jgi:predicted RNA-binding Zn-ribbon protein involved in translation (DUF1610 family)
MITPQTFPDYQRVNPLDGLPEYLKDPENYYIVQKALLETLSCGKTHSDPVKMAECPKCTQNMITRRKLMKQMGFKSAAQYFAWRRVHEKIEEHQKDRSSKYYDD